MSPCSWQAALSGSVLKGSMSPCSWSAALSGSALREVRAEGWGSTTRRIGVALQHTHTQPQGRYRPKRPHHNTSLCWFSPRIFTLPPFLFFFWHLYHISICIYISLSPSISLMNHLDFSPHLVNVHVQLSIYSALHWNHFPVQSSQSFSFLSSLAFFRSFICKHSHEGDMNNVLLYCNVIHA